MKGLDWGGLRREWIELLCVAIFDRRQSGMFTSFSDDVQALVHPNPKMPATCKLKHYEFAGKLVGKCLYESSLVLKKNRNIHRNICNNYKAFYTNRELRIVI